MIILAPKYVDFRVRRSHLGNRRLSSVTPGFATPNQLITLEAVTVIVPGPARRPDAAEDEIGSIMLDVARQPTSAARQIGKSSCLCDIATATGTSYARRSLVDEAKQHLSSNDLKQFNVELAVASDQHGLGFSVVQVALNQLIDKLYPNAVPALGKGVIGYLSLRSQAGWLANEIGVIA
ncbi:hypothetical protein [Burkholderia multivorans]|uniref:hypothetical protein n=1 Tax=Burkholderia multivorans TaxID=87883 RepID=UPI0020192156|nr:hypothetical protein [Burkholderia multivorans]MCO1380725.1 hypothetical protein [Burkholderia multivorans]MCO1400839.1 hypothetical protein [Burkholderia multivorans]UQO77424.1 hypothetical protein L0Z12_16760 [Burkholderia multivorans]